MINTVSWGQQEAARHRYGWRIISLSVSSPLVQFINQASGSSLHVVMNLESSVEGVQLSDEFTLDERKVVLIDTPGFDNTSRSDADILISIAAFLATA